MGQKWIVANLDKKEMLDPHDFDESRLLMKWSYINNITVNKLMSLMATSWKGDEITVVGSYTTREYNGENLYEYCSSFKHLTSMIYSPYRYVINHHEYHYFDIKRIKNYRYVSNINPIPLLLAGPENAEGGDGDYIGDNIYMVGAWIPVIKEIEITNDTEYVDSLNYKETLYDFKED